MNMVYSFGQNDENKIEEKKLSLQNYKKKKVSFFIGIGLLCLLTVFFPFVFFGCANQSGEGEATSYTVTWSVGGLSHSTYGAYNGGVMGYVLSADYLIGNIGGRNYYHRYSGLAYVGFVYEQVSGTTSYWTSPIVVSKTETGAQYYCDYCVSLGNNHHCCESYSGLGSGYIWFNVLNNRWYSSSTYSSATTYIQKWYYYGGSHAMQVATSAVTPANKYIRFFKASSNSNIEQNALDLMQKGQTVTTTQTASAKISLPVAPRREGHTFLGWYTNQRGALGTQITSSTIYSWTANKTFYARFRPNYYKIEFEARPEEGPTTIGDTIIVSAGSMVSYETLYYGCCEYFEGLSYVTEPFELAFTWEGATTFLPESLDASGIYYHEFFEMCHGYVYEIDTFILVAQLTRERCT